MTKASDNAFPSVLITEGTEPSAPAAGHQRLYIDSTTHLLKATNSSGTDRTIEGISDPMTTRGDIIIRNASNVTARLGRGSASQVLTSDGTDVAWAAPGGGSGALTLLSTTTLGSDTASITVTGISGSYKDLVVIGKLRCTSSAAVLDAWIRLGNSSADSGSNYSDQTTFSGTGTGTVSSDSATKVYLGPHTAATTTAGVFSSVQLQIMDYVSTSVPRFITGTAMHAATGHFTTIINGVWRNASAAVDVVSLFPDSANFLTGSRVYIYGRG